MSLRSSRRNWLRLCLVLLLLGLWVGSMGVLQRSEITIALAQRSRNDPSASWLAAGLELYQRGRFQQAAQIWEQEAITLATRQEQLSEAMVRSNLSLAYQKLGQWQPAEEQIRRSLQILEIAPGNPQVRQEIRAKVWNAWGQWHWAQGQYQQALVNWQQAAVDYEAVDQTLSGIRTRINQTQALLALGLNPRAAEILEDLGLSLSQDPDSDLKATALTQLGATFRRVGRLQDSHRILEQSLRMAQAPAARYGVLLELGNTEWAMAHRQIQMGEAEQAPTHYRAALNAYQQATDLADPLSLDSIRPQLNRLSLWIEIGRWSEAAALATELQGSWTDLPLTASSITTQLNYAHSLVCLKQGLDLGNLECSTTESPVVGGAVAPTWSQIEQVLLNALQQSHTLANTVTESHSLGQLGHLYELQGETPIAQDLTQQALLRLERYQAPELQFRWEWQLARLLDQQGDREGALDSFAAAVETLALVRRDLLTTDPDVQFSFHNTAEPVYREYLDLLLSPDHEPTPLDLQTAVDTIKEFQLAELEEFFRCSLDPYVELDRDLAEIDPKAAFLYPIILTDRVATLYQLPDRPIQIITTPASRSEVRQTIEQLRQSLLRRDVSQVIAQGSQLYDWIFPPQLDLQETTVETLVFVVGADLFRNVPLATLYDQQAEQYLVEKPYAITTLPSPRLFDLTPTPVKPQLLAASIDQPLTVGELYFPALNTQAEIQQLASRFPQIDILTNTQFTPDRIREQLNQTPYSIVHLATHGNFSSDPQQTYLLAYGSNNQGVLLRAEDVEELLGAAPTVIDLLMLSACQTAVGDNRSPLGLAGIAIRSGARSTIASLWKVEDRAISRFSELFYDLLSREGLTYGQALRQAQVQLMQDPGFQNPYFWAPYTLVGSWQSSNEISMAQNL